ncbi:hypothetical protein [Methylobacterium sp. sgz302541]|uniref:hypothetical protein n=1 Tax=Methylobacterium sp. sgz302541 TaxID=3418177 RepID=UPI003D33FD7D
MLSRLRPLTGPRYGWLAGLPVLALVWVGAASFAAPSVEQALESAGARIGAEASAGSPEPWLRVSAFGRDLIAKGEAPGPAQEDAALRRLAALSGPRLIRSEVSLIGEASPFVWTATRGGGDAIALSGSRPAEIGRAALAALVTADLPATTRLSDEAKAARGAPPGFPAAAAFSLARLRELAKGGTATLTGSVIEIKGEALSVAAYDALRTAFAEPPRGYSFGRLEILPPTVADARFGVERRPDGGLVLTGHVPTEAARAGIRAVAAETAEGAFVDDRTQTARGLPAAVDADALARFSLRLAGLLRQGEVRFADGRVSVSGDALDSQAREEIAGLLRDARPAGVGAGSVAVGASPLSPYKVAIRREADAVVLTGHLPDAAARERLLAALRPRFFRERIVDRTRLAEGAPAGLAEALEAAVPSLATLASGEVAVADSVLTLSGESLYRQSAQRLTDSLPRALPPAWTGRVTVQAPGAPSQSDAETCRSRFASETARPLVFEPGSALLKTGFYPQLDALAALVKACPGLRIAVSGHVDPPGTKPKPATDPAVPQTASIAKNAASKNAAARNGAAKSAVAKNTVTKSVAKDAAPGKAPAPNASKDAKPGAKPGPSKKPETAAKAAAAHGTVATNAVAPVPPATTDGAGTAAPAEDKAETKAAATVASSDLAAPEPDLARQRALAILDYLLAAGVPLDRIVVGEASRPAALGIGFEPRP